MHLNIAGSSIEKCLKGVNGAVLLHHNALEGDARNLQFACHLRVHDILAPCHSTIRPAVDTFKMETLLLGQRYFLGMKTGQIRHLALELCEIHQ